LDIQARLSRFRAEIRAREKQFPLLLGAVLLTLLALPFANLHGNIWARFGLPVSIDLLILQSIRALPAWQTYWKGISLNKVYQLLGLLGSITIWVPFAFGHHFPLALRLAFTLTRGCFYVMTATRMIQVLAGCSRVNGRTLCLAAAGYIHLGLTGGQIATALQVADNDSFRLGTMTIGEELLARLSYFTFVTIGTLGYGDVVPASPIGESFVVLLSLCSTLYVSLLIGLLLSRYIHDRTQASRSARGEQP